MFIHEAEAAVSLFRDQFACVLDTRGHVIHTAATSNAVQYIYFDSASVRNILINDTVFFVNCSQHFGNFKPQQFQSAV